MSDTAPDCISIVGFDRRTYQVMAANVRTLHGNRNNIAKVLANIGTDDALGISPNIPTSYFELAESAHRIVHYATDALDSVDKRDMRGVIRSLYDVVFTSMEIFAGNNLTESELAVEPTRHKGWYIEQIHKAFAIADQQDQKILPSIGRVRAHLVTHPRFPAPPYSEKDYVYTVLVDAPDGALVSYRDPIHNTVESAPTRGYMGDLDRARTDVAMEDIRETLSKDTRLRSSFEITLTAIALNSMGCNGPGEMDVASTVIAMFRKFIDASEAVTPIDSHVVETTLQGANAMRECAMMMSGPDHSLHDELTLMYQRRLVLDSPLKGSFLIIGRLLKQAPHLASEAYLKLFKEIPSASSSKYAAFSDVVDFLFPHPAH